MRQYVAMNDQTPIGSVGSVRASDCACCSNIYVAPAFRPRGIARALMTRMLQEDRATGARASVLLASHSEANLYTAVD